PSRSGTTAKRPRQRPPIRQSRKELIPGAQPAARDRTRWRPRIVNNSVNLQPKRQKDEGGWTGVFQGIDEFGKGVCINGPAARQPSSGHAVQVMQFRLYMTYTA